MRKTVFVMVEIVLVVIIVVFCASFMSKSVTEDTVDITATAVIEENKAPYPKDDRELVECDFMIEMLQKKSDGEKLDPEIENLIYYLKIQQDGHGIAWVDVHNVGMQKTTSRIFETADFGNTWNVLKSEYYLSNGEYNCAYIGDTLIVSNYSSVTETANFVVSHDRGHSFKSVPNSEVLRVKFNAKQLIPRKLYEDDKKETVVYGWLNGDIESEKYGEYILIAEYDKNLKVIDEFVCDKSTLDKFVNASDKDVIV